MINAIKVDRIYTTSEAETIQALGATLISVSLHPDPRFQDDRTISVDRAIAIKQSLKSAKYVGELDFSSNPTQSLEIAKTIGFDYVQPIGQHIPAQDLRRDLETAGIGIIYANIEVAHDDDPGWILSRYEDETELNSAYFQIDLLPEYQNSWDFLKNESPEYEEEIQIEDINQLGKQHNLLVMLDYTPQNVLEIIHTLPTIQGIALVLGSHPSRNDLHFVNYATVVDVLKALHQRSN